MLLAELIMYTVASLLRLFLLRSLAAALLLSQVSISQMSVQFSDLKKSLVTGAEATAVEFSTTSGTWSPAYCDSCRKSKKACLA